MVAAAIAASTAPSSSSGGASPDSASAVDGGSSSKACGSPEGFEIEVCGGGGAASSSSAMAGPLSLASFLKDSVPENDKLNLAALLNVLDGVVDTPDRIVIMTSNHPEKLDPALVRPGRINRKLFLGNVKLAQAAAMVRHYFTSGAPLPVAVEARLSAAFVDDVLSPAQVESMCAEHEDMDEMVDALVARLAAEAPQKMAPPPLSAAGSLKAASSVPSRT